MKPFLFIIALLVAGACAWILMQPVDPTPLPFDASARAQQEQELEAISDLEPGANFDSDQAADVGVASQNVERTDITPTKPQLNESNSLLITVVDTTGNPLPGATVYVHDAPAGSPVEEYFNEARQKSLERMFEVLCTLHTADAQAQLRIPKPTGKLILAGSTRKHFGCPVTISIEDDKTTLVLDLANSILVRVVDRGGNPVPGVPVVLYEDDRPADNGMIQARTDAAGIASIKVAWTVQRELDEGAATSVGVNLLSEKPIAEEVDLANLPEEPLRLVIPPTGQVEVLVKGRDGGEPDMDSFLVLYSLTKRNDGVANWSKSNSPLAQRSSDGRALFTHVGLGLLLRAESASIVSRETLSTDMAGPQRPGELVTIVVEPEAGSSVIVGRIVNTEGMVAKNLTMQTRLRLHQRGVMQTVDHLPLVTDDEGRFKLLLKEPYKSGTERSLTVVMRPTKRKAQRSVFVDLSRDLPAGEYDLGDLVVDFPPPIFAGRVVNSFGEPIHGARVEGQRFTTVPDSNGRTYWDDLRYWRAHTDEDGLFEIKGYPEDGLLRLEATASTYGDVQQEVHPGDMNVELMMERAFEVKGRLLLDPEIDHTGLVARLHRPNPMFPDDPYNQSVHVREDGTFYFGEQPRGDAKVLVWSTTFREELYVLDNLFLHSEEKVMEIPDIDLRGKLSCSEIAVVNEERDPLVDAWIRLPGGRTGRIPRSGSLPIVRLQGPFTLEAGAPGKRSRTIEGIVGDTEIMIGEASLNVQLQVENAHIVPAGWLLTAALLYELEDGRIDSTRSQILELDPDFRCQADVPLPGTYAVKFLITHTEEGKSSKMFGLGNGMDFATIEIFDEADQQLQVSIDPQELSEAMEKILAWERKQ